MRVPAGVLTIAAGHADALAGAMRKPTLGPDAQHVLEGWVCRLRATTLIRYSQWCGRGGDNGFVSISAPFISVCIFCFDMTISTRSMLRRG